MKRSSFIKGAGLFSAGLFVAPNTILGQDKPAAYQKEVVSKFVGASHSDLEKIKGLLEEFPNLIYSSWDWGGGDFETGIGAGGHVGNKAIVNFLLDQGARPTIHALTMLGKTNLVKPILEEYPQLINSAGPHGFTLVHHAERGGEDSVELLTYLQEKGAKSGKLSLW
ncbi:hypothetical protein [Marinoscillum sp.]|uniref:hypothetical protein n=1 Tax=Marinoscillum sp. TaxID=2024838 RepID=UPI003BABE7D1